LLAPFPRPIDLEKPMRRKLIFAFVILVLGIAGALWFERTPLLLRFYVHGLSRADENHRQTWIKRLTAMGESAAPALIDSLRSEDMQVCANAAQALGQLADSWQPGDSRCLGLAERLAHALPTRSAAGQLAILEVHACLLGKAEKDPAVLTLVPVAARSIMQVSAQHETSVHGLALAQAFSLMKLSKEPAVLEACRHITRICLHDESASTRISGIRAAMRPEVMLLGEVVPLLADADAEVRRCAVLAVGASPSVISTDALLPLLHDDNAEVRHLCEQALRSRGLEEQHLKLGRLMTDPLPDSRLQVVDLLRRVQNLEPEPAAWLRHLSHDSSPAVRAAALRVGTEQSASVFRDRLEQMVQDDPSPTVRQIAQYYLLTAHTRQSEPLPR
jgi:HEAT repeat protein